MRGCITNLLGVAACLVVLISLMFVATLFLPGAPSARRYASLKEQARPLIEAIEQYKVQHGRYPETLAKARIGTLTTRYGPWEYRSSEDGRNAILTVGNYMNDKFRLTWRSGYGWSVDE